MFTNAGMDLMRHAALERQALQSHLHDAEHERAEQAAERIFVDGRPDSSPEVVEVGSEEDVKDHFTFADGNVGDDVQRVRTQLQKFGNLRPAQYLHKANVLIGPKMRNATEHEVVAIGLVCWRCGDAQPEDKHVVADRHRRLRETFPLYSIPAGKTESDCCCTCGAVLGLNEGVA